MKKSKVVINKSFYLGDLKKDILFFNAMHLIKENVVVYGIDSYGRCYTKKDTDIEIQDVDIEKDYMKVYARFTKPEFIDTIFKEINLERAILMYTQEQEIWINPMYHLDLFMLPFQVKVLEKDVLIYPIIKIFENNSIIISYKIYIDDESDFDEFEKVYADFNRHIFKRLTIPVNYAPEYKKENEVDAVMDEENVKYIEVDCKNEEFRNIINFSWYLLNLINHSDESVTFYARCSYFIESNKNNHVGKKFIDTLLKGVKGNYKYELKDNSINKNYKKYFNERASIVVGENAEQIESEIQAIEERMMLQVLEQSQIIENLKNDKYTYNELRKIYNKILYENIEYRDSNYGEIEDTLELMHTFMKSKEKIEFLKTGLEEKIKEKENYYQEKTALFALLLSASPICDYIFFPIINNILHFEKIYSFIEKIKTTQLCFLIKAEYLRGLCFISTIVLIYILYKKFIKKK
ncbi:MAG: hypothetical protein IKG14_00540 [Clostridia bacterium]|nr:hypothetical protein [Clostridia bacterium]